MTRKRLIEVDFPLKQTSLDAVHEKNVRHGHISTLHIWPARRPLAACRAALIATLLPDPGDDAERKALYLRLAGTVETILEAKADATGRVVDTPREVTVGGILHWGRENGADLDGFREEIRKAHGGRAPRVLDPFAGGGAIPLEAMRLGCEVTAADLNPVAWFILKCTLEYPQRLAGEKRRLPDFAIADHDFMADYFKALGFKPKEIRGLLENHEPEAGENLRMFAESAVPEPLLSADLAWHVRAWGRWVLREARRELAEFYPTYAEYCTLKPYATVPLARLEEDRLRLVPVDRDGLPRPDLLNEGADPLDLVNAARPRWIAKPTVAYLWARTVRCKSCRAELPLLKTAWLANKKSNRVRLTLAPNENRTGVVFGIERNVPKGDDKALGAGTMNRSGARCPCCPVLNTLEDIRLEARAGRMSAAMTAVVVDSPGGKEYRLPTPLEIRQAEAAADALERVYAEIPFGLPEEPIIEDAKHNTWCIGYGLDAWKKVFTPRQLLALGQFVRAARRIKSMAREHGYNSAWCEALTAMMALGIDRLADRSSSICIFDPSPTQSGVMHTFARFALPMTWDFAEGAPLVDSSGSFTYSLEWIALYLGRHFGTAPAPTVVQRSAISDGGQDFDVILTDPPYYDAIGYSVLMDFFYVWLRRTLHGLSSEIDAAFAEPLAPKWDHAADDGELIDDAARFGGDREASKRNYEAGMARAFQACHRALKPDGRLVIVFAHKHPDAWATLVTAIIRAGFVVDGSWPIQTERAARTRSIGSAALSSSVWLVCRKRAPNAPAGWDSGVLEDMRQLVGERLRSFWDAGIRGPDFLWAATGPALEAYSQFPRVMKYASAEGAVLSVDEFLREVRRLVVDFAVGRILHQDDGDGLGLDDVTTYYLLHRANFGLANAPAGACILYATSCGVAMSLLTDQTELLASGKTRAATGEDGDEDAADDGAVGSGGEFRLRIWSERRHRSLGEDAANGRVAPLIDQVHKLMQLWKAGDLKEVNAYLDRRGLRHSSLFPRLLQALIETSRAGKQTDECAILESLSNHLGGLGQPGFQQLF